MRRSGILAGIWLAFGVGTIAARGISHREEDPPICPYPGSGIVHLYGEVESVTVVWNPVEDEDITFYTLLRNRKQWDEKHLLTLRIDSGRGRDEIDAPLVSYPKVYGVPFHRHPLISLNGGRLAGSKGLFRFERRDGEWVLQWVWTWNQLTWDPKVCRERPPPQDSLDLE